MCEMEEEEEKIAPRLFHVVPKKKICGIVPETRDSRATLNLELILNSIRVCVLFFFTEIYFDDSAVDARLNVSRSFNSRCREK